MTTYEIIGLIAIGGIIALVGAIGLFLKKKKKNDTPDDIYPMW